jgi:hypothetical protein
MKRRIVIAWRQAKVDGYRAAFRFLLTGRGLAEWEQALLAVPIREGR